MLFSFLICSLFRNFGGSDWLLLAFRAICHLRLVVRSLLNDFVGFRAELIITFGETLFDIEIVVILFSFSSFELFLELCPIGLNSQGDILQG